jgi:hypothetical protein
MRLLLLVVACAIAIWPATLNSAETDPVVAGEFLIDPPTLINLGFEWFIEGDANRTAVVEVSYRKAGEARWHDALPLLRLNGERIKNGSSSTWWCRTCSPAASSTSSPTRATRRDSS